MWLGCCREYACVTNRALHTAKFYQATAYSLEMKKRSRELRQWEGSNNIGRPHQSLGCLTLEQFLLRAGSQRKECKVSPIYSTSTHSCPGALYAATLLHERKPPEAEFLWLMFARSKIIARARKCARTSIC
jgi:hypothetical protein